jgi:hypothetical protein
MERVAGVRQTEMSEGIAEEQIAKIVRDVAEREGMMGKQQEAENNGRNGKQAHGDDGAMGNLYEDGPDSPPQQQNHHKQNRQPELREIRKPETGGVL